MKTAIVHDWLVTFAGAEKALAEILSLFPDADIFSVVDFLDDEDRARLLGKRAATTFIQGLPKAREKYRSYLPLMPLAIESLDLSGYDLVISSSHAVAKGVVTGPDQVHVSYVYTPIRYAWDMEKKYLRWAGLEKGVKGWLARAALHYIRMWDRGAAAGPCRMAAISSFIARRIRHCYGREAAVIYPPVDVGHFTPREAKEDFYLTASRLVQYKNVELIVRAFSAMTDKKLIVVGDGPEMGRLASIAGRNVKLLGYQPDAKLRELMASARAFVFAAEEDFGIAPVEAQAAGTPVIAYGRGGARETVIPGETGLFFDEDTPAALSDAVRDFEGRKFSAARCRENAQKFSKERFREEFFAFVTSAVKEYGTGGELHDGTGA